MEENFNDYISGSKDLLGDYVDARWKLMRLGAAAKAANSLGVFLGLLVAAMLGFFTVMFLGLLLAYWISESSGSLTLGFAVSALLFLLLLILVVIFRRPLIQRPLANALIRELAEEIEEDPKSRSHA